MKQVIAVFAIIGVIVTLAINSPKTFVPTALIFVVFLYLTNRK